MCLRISFRLPGQGRRVLLLIVLLLLSIRMNEWMGWVDGWEEGEYGDVGVGGDRGLVEAQTRASLTTAQIDKLRKKRLVFIDSLLDGKFPGPPQPIAYQRFPQGTVTHYRTDVTREFFVPLIFV